MMNCKEFHDFLAAYVDGELPEDVHQVFQRHIEKCPPCLVYLDGYRLTIRVAKTACDQDLPVAKPAEVPEELIQAILEAKKKVTGS